MHRTRRRAGIWAALVGTWIVAGLSLAGTAAAHEEYVVGPLLAGGVAVLALVVGYLHFEPLQQDLAAFRFAMREYTEYVPWLLRISFGIPLIGAGFAGYFVSPSVEVELRLLQVTLGFLLLFGLATRAVALATLAVYLVGAVVWPELLYQFEFVGGMLAIALVGSGKPSADHVLQRIAGTPGTLYGRVDVVHDRARTFQRRVEPYERLLPTVTRAGLGATFFYLGVSQKLLRPGIALEVVEQYELTAVVPVPAELWVLGAGLTEATLGIALVLGIFTRAGAAVAIGMFTLTLFALPDDPVLAHVALFGMTSVLLITGGGPYSVDNRMEAVEDEVEEDVEAAAPTA